MLSRFCVVKWKRGFRCSIWWFTRWGSQLSLSRLGRSRFGAYQGLAQKIKVPFSRIFCLFLQFWGSEGDFKTRAKPRYAPNSGWNAFRDSRESTRRFARFTWFAQIVRAACLQNETPCPSFPWSFRKHQGKPQKYHGKDFLAVRTLKNTVKQTENTQKTKEIPRKKTTKETKNTKEKKDRAAPEKF